MADNYSVLISDGVTEVDKAAKDIGGVLYDRMILSTPDGVDVDPVVQVAHDAADSGNPTKIGGKANTALSDNTIVADLDRTDAMFDLDGAIITREDSAQGDRTQAFISCTSGANTSALSAGGAGVYIYVTEVDIYNNGSSNGALLLTDGSGGSTLVKIPFPASTGTVWRSKRGVKFSANTAVYADPTGSDTIDVSIRGYKSKV